MKLYLSYLACYPNIQFIAIYIENEADIDVDTVLYQTLSK